MAAKEYNLTQRGRLNFELAKTEGLALFDLPRLARYIPAGIGVVTLEGETMGDGRSQILAAGKTISDPMVKRYLVTCGKAINSVVADRNHVAHSRPAQNSSSGHDELLRRRRDGTIFLLDEIWIDARLAEIAAYQVELDSLRPPLT